MAILDFITDLRFDATTLLVGILTCIIIHQLLAWLKRTRNLPPAPWFQLPVIGHMHLLQSDLRQVVRPLRRKFGDIYRLQLGSRMVIVLGGYANLKEAFVKNAELFGERPIQMTLQAVTKDRGFANYNGPRWKEHRRFVLSNLKDLGMGRRVLEDRILAGLEPMIRLFRETREQPFYPRPIVNTFVWNVIAGMLFGETAQQGDPIVSNMLEMIEENLRNAATAAILNLLPWLNYLPGDPFLLQSCVRNADKVHAFSDEIVRKHQQRADKTAVDDLTSAYLKAMEEKEANKEATSFTLDNLSGTISDMFIAGSETTTTALSWAIVCLVAYPEVQAKLHEEIVANIGRDQVPSVADRSNLAYVEAFYMEVLRFCNLTPVLVTHSVSRDTTFLGYTIPTDAILFVDFDSVATDPEIWGDPANFRPERFLDVDGKLVKKEEFIMFFFGKRSCIGESLARMELFLTLIRLVQNFEFVSPNDATLTLDSVDGEFGIVHAPKHYKVVATQRQL